MIPPRPSAHRTRAGAVDVAALRARRLGRDAREHRQRRRDGQHIDGEHPPPRPDVDQRATQQRPDDERDARPGGPGADRLALIRPAEVRDDDRQRARDQQRARRRPAARARRSGSWRWARSRASSDVTPKPIRPAANTRLRPNRSDSDPASRMNDPSVTRYASTIHCCAEIPPPRFRRIAGSATLTTDISRNATKEPRMLASRTSRWART